MISRPTNGATNRNTRAKLLSRRKISRPLASDSSIHRLLFAAWPMRFKEAPYGKSKLLLYAAKQTLSIAQSICRIFILPGRAGRVPPNTTRPRAIHKNSLCRAPDTPQSRNGPGNTTTTCSFLIFWLVPSVRRRHPAPTTTDLLTFQCYLHNGLRFRNTAI